MIRRPVFFHIGWMRTGTTSLQALFQHNPDILLSLKNRFFSYDPFFMKGAELYESLVGSRDAGQLIIIDSDENYSVGRFKTLLQEESGRKFNYGTELQCIYHDIEVMAHRIKSIQPEARIFATIRRQSDWLLSVYKHDVYNYALDQPLQAFLDNNLGKAYLRAADYYNVVQLYRRLFGEENVKIFLFEELIHDQSSYLNAISEFLGVELDVSRLRKNQRNKNPSDFIINLCRHANSLSQTDIDRPENNVYQWSRNAIRVLNRVMSLLGWMPDTDITYSGYEHDIQQMFESGNRELGRLLGISDRLQSYGYISE